MIEVDKMTDTVGPESAQALLALVTKHNYEYVGNATWQWLCESVNTMIEFKFLPNGNVQMNFIATA